MTCLCVCLCLSDCTLLDELHSPLFSVSNILDTEKKFSIISPLAQQPSKTHNPGSTRSASTRRRGVDGFERRLYTALQLKTVKMFPTAAMSGARHDYQLGRVRGNIFGQKLAQLITMHS